VARHAPIGRAAEVTGAVLSASYAGLLLGPALAAAAAALGGLTASYLLLAVLASAATMLLFGDLREKAHPDDHP
jgi:hypothetical protein